MTNFEMTTSKKRRQRDTTAAFKMNQKLLWNIAEHFSSDDRISRQYMNSQSTT